MISELTPQQASLEEAFMSLTGESVEYRASAGEEHDSARAREGRGMSATETLPASRRAERAAPSPVA